MVGIFNSAIFNNQVFNTGATAPDIILLGGGPGGSKWDKKKHEYFFTPAWQLFEREMQALEDTAAVKEQELHDAQSARAVPANAAGHEQIAAYEEHARQDVEAREQFLIYEQNMRQEINGLRMRRDRLIRQRQEEAVILTILQSLPPLH